MTNKIIEPVLSKEFIYEGTVLYKNCVLVCVPADGLFKCTNSKGKQCSLARSNCIDIQCMGKYRKDGVDVMLVEVDSV